MVIFRLQNGCFLQPFCYHEHEIKNPSSAITLSGASINNMIGVISMENNTTAEHLYKIKMHTITELAFKVCINFDHFRSALDLIVPKPFLLKVISHQTYTVFYQAIKSLEAYLEANHADGTVDLNDKSISLS
jgi:hypothetical protein